MGDIFRYLEQHDKELAEKLGDPYPEDKPYSNGYLNDTQWFFCGKRLVCDHRGFNIDNAKAKTYLEYAGETAVISFASEGLLCSYFEVSGDFPPELEKIIKSRGLYYEANESWNWSIYEE